MEKDINSSKLTACLLALGFLAVGAGCADKDYDLSNVDTTIGVGGDALQLPISDTEEIMLDDVINLNNNEYVIIADNGDYMIEKEGDPVKPSHPEIDKVVVHEARINNNFKVYVTLPQSAPVAKQGKHRVSQIDEVTAEGKTVEFDYTGAASSHIKDISEAKTSSDISIHTNISPNLKRLVPTFKTLTLSIPPYMKLNIGECSPSQPDYDATTGKVVFHNVSSSDKIELHATLASISFKEKATAENSLVFTPGKDGKDGKVELDGVARMSVTFDEIDETATSRGDLYVSSTMTMGDITVYEATGKFDPDINIDDLGTVDIGDTPDFLDDDEVTINLYNPVVKININSDINIGGYLSGTVFAEDKNGELYTKVVVPEFYIKPGGLTRIAICKYADAIDASLYDDVVEIPNLSEVIARVPKALRFEANAHADSEHESTMELGKNYTINTDFSVTAPLAFDKGATIVYKDTLDGWNGDIKDIEFTDGAALVLTTDIENKMPAYLHLAAWALGTNGEIIPHEKINVDVSSTIKGSPDGETVVTTPLTVRLSEEVKDSFKDVDGIVFRVTGSSSDGNESIVGKTINAYNHTLRANNIKVRLEGRVIVNNDDDNQ